MERQQGRKRLLVCEGRHLPRVGEPGQFDVKPLATMEQQRALGLVLGRSCHPPGHRQMSQKLLHLVRTHAFRMALPRIPGKSSSRIQIGLFSADAAMLEANPTPDLLKGAARRADPAGDGIDDILGSTKFD